jgi:hypothetical protein
MIYFPCPNILVLRCSLPEVAWVLLVRGRGAAGRANRQQWRIPVAGCTVEQIRGRRINKPLKHGRYTAEAIARRREVAALIRAMHALACATRR